MKKFNIFYLELIADGAIGHHTALCPLKLSRYVTEIPDFENEQQAFDFYKGVYLANQLRVDQINATRKKGFFSSKEENWLPETVYIIQEFSI